MCKMAKTKTFTWMLIIGSLSGTHGYLLDDLLAEVLRGYERAVRPRCDVTSTTNVTVDMALRQVVDLNEPLQILNTIVWIRLAWRDCRLTWNTSHYRDLERVVVPQDRVWVPDVTLYDNADKTMLGAEEYSLSINNDGNIKYNFPTFIKSLCTVDVTSFPFDHQACKLTFGSWSYSGDQINITTSSGQADMASFVPNSEWRVQTSVVRRETDYGTEVFPTVTFIIRLDRRPLFYVLNLLFPCCLISSVAMLGFLLPPASGEKMNLEITVMLSLSVFQLIVLEMMPPAGDRVPFIAMYFTVSLVLVGLSCLATVIVLNLHFKAMYFTVSLVLVGLSCLATVVVLNLHFKGFQAIPIPDWCHSYIFLPLARLTHTNIHGQQPYVETLAVRSRRASLSCGNYGRRLSSFSIRSNNSQRRRPSQDIGRLSDGTYIKRFSTCSTVSENGMEETIADTTYGEQNQNGAGVNGDVFTQPMLTSVSQYPFHKTFKSEPRQNDLLDLLVNVNNILGSLNEYLHEGDVPIAPSGDSRVGATWPLFALVLDRLFMGIYFVFLVIGAIVMIVKYIVLSETPDISV